MAFVFKYWAAAILATPAFLMLFGKDLLAYPGQAVLIAPLLLASVFSLTAAEVQVKDERLRSAIYRVEGGSISGDPRLPQMYLARLRRAKNDAAHSALATTLFRDCNALSEHIPESADHQHQQPP